MNHTIYTRHTYPPGDERHCPRLELAMSTCVPSVIDSSSWTALPVRWVWWASPLHRMEIIDAVRAGGYQGELHVLPGDTWLEDDHIQTTLDSDDMLGAHLLDRVQHLYLRDRADAGPHLVTYQPIKLDLETGRRYRARMKYSAESPSMFYSILRPTPEVQVYKRTHTEMGELCPARLDPFPSSCMAGIHGANHLMKIHPDEERIA